MSEMEEEDLQPVLERMERMAYQLDQAAMNTYKTLMEGAQNEKLKLESAQSWLQHRRELRLAQLRLQRNDGLTFNFNLGAAIPHEREVKEAAKAWLSDESSEEAER